MNGSQAVLLIAIMNTINEVLQQRISCLDHIFFFSVKQRRCFYANEVAVQ